MLLEVLILVAGLAMLVKGGELFVSASVRIAEFLRMPRIVIGSTLVSLTTTSPELVVSVVAALKQEPGLAVGNAVGSCICNIGLILGLMAALKHIDVHPPALRTPLLAMTGFGILLLFLTLDLRVPRWQGAVLLLLGAAYFIYDFVRHKRDTKPEDLAEAAAIETELAGRHRWFHTRLGTAVQFLIGAGIVIAGSKLLVDSAVAIASALGIPSMVIGLTIVAVGTSLPELVTALTSARQNVSDLAVGNVLGANVANLTLIIGSAASIHPVSMSRVTQLFNFPAMLFIMAVLTWMLLSGKRVTRKEGAAMLCLYGLYIGALVTITVFKGG